MKEIDNILWKTKTGTRILCRALSDYLGTGPRNMGYRCYHEWKQFCPQCAHSMSGVPASPEGGGRAGQGGALGADFGPFWEQNRSNSDILGCFRAI